jgi:rRNA maturation RNase YbeY
VLADIYISVERVKENAVAYESSFSQELLRVIFHGALHLAGYKDKTSGQTKEMRRKEEEYLHLYRVPRSTVSAGNNDR